jgi:ABC-type branched-subunit amino acid transport system substrate-binding protein/predicted negative regulator of RcsB-dependent stress response
MNSRAEIFRGVTLWLLPFILMGCALLPPKKEVAVKPPVEVGEKEALQQLAMAEEAFEAGNLEEASQRYQELAMAFPRSPQAARALLRQGEIDYGLEMYDKAASWFQNVINKFPVRPEGDEARLWLLRCYLKLERYNDAVEAGRSLIKYLPEKSQKSLAAEVVGDAEAARLNYDKAVRWYAKSYELSGEDKHIFLAAKVDIVLENLGKEEVVALAAEYTETFPNFQLQTRLVEIDMESGQFGIAQEQLKALMEERPDHPLVDTWKGMEERIKEWLKVDMNAVGCILPLSGRYQAYGDRVLRGVVMAAQDFKDKGGDIELIIRDSGGDPDLAVAAVRDLVLDNKVAAIIGPLSRVAAEEAAEQAERLWVPIITLTQKEGVSDIGNYVFRYFLSNEQQTKALVEYAVLGLDYKRFAILYPDDSYGSRLMNLFWDELERLGAELRGIERYDPSQTDFADQIKKLVGLYYPRPEGVFIDGEDAQRAGEISPEGLREEGFKDEEEEEIPIVDFDAIFIPDGYKQVGLIAPQLAYHEVTGVKLLGTNLWNSPKLVEMAAPYLQDAVFVDGFFSGSGLPLTSQFVQSYEQTFGGKPGYPEAQAYDTMRLLIEALRQPGVTSRPILRDALLAIESLPGVAGTASVGPDGEVSTPPFLITIYRRRMEEIQVDFEMLHQRRRKYLEYFSGNGFLSSEKTSPVLRSPGSSTGKQEKTGVME